jgi:hypothetical protein
MIKQELLMEDLAGTALKVLDKCDLYISHWEMYKDITELLNQRAGSRQFTVKLFLKDYNLLAARLKDTGQDITKVLYRGYELI